MRRAIVADGNRDSVATIWGKRMYCKLLLILWLAVSGSLFAGCHTKNHLPTQEKIQQQLKRDAAMRAAEDRLEKESPRAVKR